MWPSTEWILIASILPRMKSFNLYVITSIYTYFMGQQLVLFETQNVINEKCD